MAVVWRIGIAASAIITQQLTDDGVHPHKRGLHARAAKREAAWWADVLGGLVGGAAMDSAIAARTDAGGSGVGAIGCGDAGACIQLAKRHLKGDARKFKPYQQRLDQPFRILMPDQMFSGPEG